MCGTGSAAEDVTKYQWQEPQKPAPEKIIAEALWRELGIIINEQALRIFIRKEWRLISKAAHEIHDAR